MSLYVNTIVVAPENVSISDPDYCTFFNRLVDTLNPNPNLDNLIVGSGLASEVSRFSEKLKGELPKGIKIKEISPGNKQYWDTLAGAYLGSITLYNFTINEVMEIESDLEVFLPSCSNNPVQLNVLLAHGRHLENYLNKTDINSFGPLSSSILRKLEFIN